VEVKGGNMLAICVRRILGMKQGTTENIDIAMRYCFKLLRVYVEDVPSGEAIDSANSTPGRIIEIGANTGSDGVNTTVVVDTEVDEDSKGKNVKITLRTFDQIAEVVCYMTEQPRNQDNAALRPSSAKCGIFFRIPPQFYSSENSRICFAGAIMIDTPAGEVARADMRANTDANGITTVNVFPKTNDGKIIQSMGSLTLDSFAQVGGVKSPIKYAVDMQNGQIIASACIMAANPDSIWIDPEFSTDDSTYSEGASIQAQNPTAPSAGTPSSAMTIFVSMTALFATVVLALLF